MLIALAVLLMRVTVKRRTVRWVGAAAIAVSAAIGVWWVLASKALPVADSRSIITTAQKLAEGNMRALKDTTYFYVFPFQTGYLLFAEGFSACSGPIRLPCFNC